MAKRFVVATDQLNDEEVKTLKSKFASGVGWWFWLPNFWLIVDPHNNLTVSTINNWIHEINGSVRAIVIEVESKTWAACTRADNKGRDMAEWIRETWQNRSV